MQIIESTAMGVRSAVFHFRASDGGPSFLLFPMIHVGEAAFYEEISRRLDECDVVLCEGVKSTVGSLITKSYRLFVKNPKLGLVLQRTMPLDHMAGRLVHADVGGKEFDARWRKMDGWFRILLPLAAPIYGLYLRFFGTRRAIAQSMGLNLLDDREDAMADDDENNVAELMLNWRDQHLIDHIEQQLQEHEGRDVCIGVLYGASHMRAVIRHLMGPHNYQVSKAEWVMVFST